MLLNHPLFPPPSSPHVVLAEDSMHSGQAFWFSLFLHSQLQCLRTLMTPRLSERRLKAYSSEALPVALVKKQISETRGFENLSILSADKHQLP